MTPAFWHKVAKKVEPWKRKLVFGAAIGLTGAVVSFSSLLEDEQGREVAAWLPLCLFFSTIVAFWRFGLLQILRQYGASPVKSNDLLGRAVYFWDFFFSWVGAWFYTVWFLGLALVTVATPFILI